MATNNSGVTDSRVKTAMREANVPTHIFKKTLPLLGQMDLRIWIESAAYLNDGRNKTENMFIYPMRPAETMYARNVVYTVAKELVLRGEQIIVLPLMRFAECCKYDSYEPEELRSRVENCVMLIVMDFYEQGETCPLSPKELAMVRNALRERMEDENRGVILHASQEPANCDWWSHGFRQEIISQSTIVALADRENA